MKTEFSGYDHWGKRVWIQIVHDPFTEEQDWQEVQDATRELGDMLCLNNSLLLNAVERHYVGPNSGTKKAAHTGRGRGNP